MSERETSKPIPEDEFPDEDIEVIDVADLMEDDSDTPDTEDAQPSGEASEEARWVESNAEAPLADEEIFRILEEDTDEDTDDDDIIDLVDRVDENGSTAAEDADDAAGEAPEEMTAAEVQFAGRDLDAELEDDFIAAFDLDEILGADPGTTGEYTAQGGGESTGDGDLDFIDALDLELNIEEPLREDSDTAPSAGDAVAAAPPMAPADSAGSGGDIALNEQQVEAALERVIRRMYADKIDAILVEAIEKTVSEEIDRLKTLLNQGAPDL